MISDKNRLQQLANLQESKEINIRYYQRLLDLNFNISYSQRRYIQDVINSVKKRNNIPTEKQLIFLKRLENNDFKYHPKN